VIKLAKYCTECGGKLEWDRKLKKYYCQSCGLSQTDADISTARDLLFSREEDDKEKKERRNRDYLDWWFTDKEKK
jgi:predicted RNA-binding Zn-ribbon protein involved in translation (DUF1610 family)